MFDAQTSAFAAQTGEGRAVSPRTAGKIVSRFSLQGTAGSALFCHSVKNRGFAPRRQGGRPQGQIKNPSPNARKIVRACLKNRPVMGLRARRVGWPGATRVPIRETSVTEEQQRQPACPAARPPGIFFRHALKVNKGLFCPKNSEFFFGRFYGKTLANPQNMPQKTRQKHP